MLWNPIQSFGRFPHLYPFRGSRIFVLCHQSLADFVVHLQSTVDFVNDPFLFFFFFITGSSFRRHNKSEIRMQTPKKSVSKNASSELPKRTSPPVMSSRTSLSNSATSTYIKTPTNRSPRVSERRSPRSPASERKRPSKLNELESRIGRLQEDLKNAKEQLASSELQAKQARQEAEEANKQIATLTAKLGEETNSDGEIQIYRKESTTDDDTQMQQLEVANATIDKLRCDFFKALESYNLVSTELAGSKAQVGSLEATVRRLREGDRFEENGEAAEGRRQEERINRAMQIKMALEAAEKMKVRSMLESTTIEERKETVTKPNEKDGGGSEGADVAELKRILMDRERELQNVKEEKDLLEVEVEKKEAERSKAIESEQDALARVGIVSEESDKTSRRAARMTEHLEASQAAKSDMEAELRRVKIQTEQWRKAAEAAAAILTNENNWNPIERSGSLDSEYNSIAGKLMNSSLFSEDSDEESPKKKTGGGNVLRKIGVFLKKGQK